MLARDPTMRPFVLTRSFFMGSQKYGTFWTGDNLSLFSEMRGSMVMLMSAGLAGHPFGGADIPGYFGRPSDNLFVQFY